MKKIKTAAVIAAAVMLIGCAQAKNTEIDPISETSLSESENEADESNIIFPDNIEQVTQIKDNPISFDEASDRIMLTKAYPEGRKLLLKSTVQASGRTFYVISAVYDNGDTVSAERTFWADVQTGDIYLYFDPTTMPHEQYSEYVGEISEDDGRSRLIPMDREVCISVSPYEKNDYNDRQIRLIAAVRNLSDDEIKNVVKRRSEFFDMSDNTQPVNILITDLYFDDFDGDGDDELITRLEFEKTPQENALYYALCYADGDNAAICDDGAASHKNVHYAKVGDQPFVVIAELGAGYSDDPVAIAEKVFTFSDGKLVPYDTEGDHLCIRVSDSGNRLYLFGSSEDWENSGDCPFLAEINSGEIVQELAWDNGRLKVVSGYGK